MTSMYTTRVKRNIFNIWTLCFPSSMEVNLKLNPNKCYFAPKSITFLGHVVSKDNMKPNPGKIETIIHFPEPKTITNIKFFLGLIGYY